MKLLTDLPAWAGFTILLLIDALVLSLARAHDQRQISDISTPSGNAWRSGRKAELEAEQAADLPETQEAPENLPEKKAEGKPGKINEDFDAAVDQMIADAKAEKNTAIAEKNSTNAEKPKKQYEKPIVSDCIVERVPDSIIRTVKLRIRSICDEVGRNSAEIERLSELTHALISEAAELTQWVEAHL